MKPYCATQDDYGDTGCCPGHDNPWIRKWSGMYKSNRGYKNISQIQNRVRRRKDKQKLRVQSSERTA